MRDNYIDRKNSNCDFNKKSRSLFTEAVVEVYAKKHKKIYK